ncbi:hypothetical protein Fcan01_10297 [Folsomia candida]|uniref:Uncharacterized protein n=1 Tax=Folsomia candida TaxID=158441 RepID=A0A226EC20_FOLCA|nr:hypothetical protein Fcan01_10297 [Folsomia candida]
MPAPETGATKCAKVVTRGRDAMGRSAGRPDFLPRFVPVSDSLGIVTQGRAPMSSLSQVRSQNIDQGSFNGTITPKTDDMIIRKLDYLQATINELRETLHLTLRNQNRTIIEDLDDHEKNEAYWKGDKFGNSEKSWTKERHQTVASYTEAMETRGAYHSKLRIGDIKSVHECNVLWYLMERLNDLKSPPTGYFDEQNRFLDLSGLIGLHVKELSMIWPSPKDVTFFTEVLSKFTNLTQVELVVTVPMDKEDFDEDPDFSPNDPRLASLKTKFPAEFALPSVKRLMIKFDYDPHSEPAHFFIQNEVGKGLARSILELCPNMECLHVEDYGKIFGHEIGRDASRFTKLGEVNFDHGDDHQVAILSLPCPLRVIHVHFGLASGLVGLQGLQEIFRKFANTLEDFKMEVDMVLWETVEPQAGLLRLKRSTILVPKMPKLKKIHISVRMSMTSLDMSKTEQRESMLRAPSAQDFVFVTASGNQKIDYDLQFPSLTTIVIKSDRPFTSDGPRKPKVLHDFFTPQIEPPCTTVRYLDIDYPDEDKEFLDRNPDCATGCDCWIWKNDITQLYKRMAETFPNVKDERFTPFRK